MDGWRGKCLLIKIRYLSNLAVLLSCPRNKYHYIYMECCHELTSWYGVLEKFIALIFLLIFDMSLGSIPILSTIWSSLRKEHGNHGHIKLSTLWDSCQLQLHRESWFYSIFIYYMRLPMAQFGFSSVFFFFFFGGVGRLLRTIFHSNYFLYEYFL